MPGSSSTIRLLCFFFQAEDGIRVTSVTGVQTCALPILISNNNTTFGAGGNLTFGAMTQDGDQTMVVNNAIVTVASLASDTTAARNLTKEGPRSEERRVGKER